MTADFDQIDHALRTLRAVRRYDGVRQVSDAQVDRWLDTARWCGSSKNSQPWRFAVIRKKETLEALARCGDYAAHLPGSSVTIAIGALGFPYRFSAIFDLGRVAQSLMLNAHADGVGSCIAVFEPEFEPRVRELLGFRDDGVCNLAIAFGYPGDRRSEPRSVGGAGRRPLEEIVGREAFPAQAG